MMNVGPVRRSPEPACDELAEPVEWGEGGRSAFSVQLSAFKGRRVRHKILAPAAGSVSVAPPAHARVVELVDTQVSEACA
jgi:hypothetical protein